MFLHMKSSAVHSFPESKGRSSFSFLRRPAIRALFLIVGAVATALTLVCEHLALLEWISLFPVFLVFLQIFSEEKPRLRICYAYGVLFFSFFYCVVFHWFVKMSSLEFTGLSENETVAVMLLGVIGLSLLQAVISALSFVAVGIAVRNRIFVRFPFLIPFLIAGAWTVFEWIQTIGWWGVPWGRLSLGQINVLPLVQSAQCFGTYFVSFLLLSVNGCIAFAILSVSLRRLAAITASVLFVGNFLLGMTLMALPREHKGSVTVAAIQGNIENKWDYSALEEIKAIYREQTALAAEAGAELIVWPETALPFDLEQTPSIMIYLQEIADQTGATLLIGCFRNETSTDGTVCSYNSIYTVFPNEPISGEFYDKQKLVPFGEFVPMRDLISVVFPPLAEIGMLDEDLSVGNPENLIHTKFGSVGGMICFDSIYEGVSLSSVREGAELICLATNDAWFQDSAAMQMHLNQARLRAIESGRYIVRAGNSGITAVLSPTGEVLTEIDPGMVGYVVSDVEMREGRTLYSLIGNAFVYLWMCGVAVLCIQPALGTLKRRRRIL